MHDPHFQQENLALALPTPTQTIKSPTKADRIIQAASLILPVLEQGLHLTTPVLREAMRSAFGANDNEGAWSWKDAYEACEAAQILFLRKHLPQMHAQAQAPRNVLPMLAAIADLIPTQTRRSDESQLYQQFSTPLELAFIAAQAAQITSHDLVLEPSAGTGMLANHARQAGARLFLNELAATRADLLASLFPSIPLTRFNAENIDDYLPRAIAPSVVLMNPPFSAKAHTAHSVRGTDMSHLVSALNRLAPGGRMVAITSASCTPSDPHYEDSFAKIASYSRVVFSAPLARSFFQRHGTAIETRFTVIDRIAPDEACPPIWNSEIREPAELLELISALPARASIAPPAPSDPPAPQMVLFQTTPRKKQTTALPATTTSTDEKVVELAYEPRQAADSRTSTSDQLYEHYHLDTIVISGANPHPSKLVQSAAMASVKPPIPTYRPHLPEHLITTGILSEPQLEAIILAGESHSQHLSGRWIVNESQDVLTPAKVDDEAAISFRRGFFIGDGTGCGKGREVAGIILDNWLKGRRRALWISKNNELLDDAQRDWAAMGRERLQVISQSKFGLGKPIELEEGILYTTYATLRSAGTAGKASRLDQILDWLGDDFDGVIITDECHAMGNAAPGESDRGKVAASLQGLAGLRLQNALPDARVVYVSATGATQVENLAYASRLGLWGSDDFPFKTRAEFVDAMHSGGLAAMEVLARDLKALGLYVARSLSYEGVEIDFLEHTLTPDQIEIYNEYADAFQVIHHNLNDALEAANVTSAEHGTLNRQAKSAARSAFESNKQRFFSHLITSMKMPSLIQAIEADLARGDAPVIQLVTTSEALMDRRLDLIPPAEWKDLNVDITPREYVTGYLEHGFPIHLYESYTDENGKTQSRPATVNGQPVICRKAEQQRDAMLERLACLPPVQSALDQMIHHFGTDTIAEITGRGRRIIKTVSNAGHSILSVENRSGSANLAETNAFMSDTKKILVFSDAGGTGRSYHADLTAKNQRRRIHYILEPGFKADAAIQGLGRTNRTNQASAPVCRPVATNVRGEKRFLSTIARRLDTLGAITKGQRQTGGQGLFRPEDNLENAYARSALKLFYLMLYTGQVPDCSLGDFEDATGLRLTDQDGSLLDTLPPIHTFLNRLLALRIDQQNALFQHFESILAGLIESAIAAGTYEIGLETITAESLRIVSRKTVEKHAGGAETLLFEVERKTRSRPVSLETALSYANEPRAKLVLNPHSRRAGVLIPAATRTLEDGTLEHHYRIIRPTETDYLSQSNLDNASWNDADLETFTFLWNQQLAEIPEFITSRFYIVTGLLLPIWKRLPRDFCRIYRFTADDGERVIGRPIDTAHLAQLGIAPVFDDPNEAYGHLMQGRSIPLSEGLCLKRSLAMYAQRIELTGFRHSNLAGLKAMGLMTETIAHTLRLFVPIGETAPAIIERVLKHYPPIAQSERDAA